MKQQSQEATQSQCKDENQLSFSLDLIKPTFGTVSIVIPKTFINALFRQSSLGQKQRLETVGFAKGDIPIEYIEQNFMSTLIEHVREFVFKYFVLPFLYKEIRNRKLLVAGDPRLSHIHVAYDEDAVFNFDLSLFEQIPLQEWRYFPFKAPKRKKYKDLDRQVDSFVKEERTRLKEFKETDSIHTNDWVLFFIELIDTHEKPIFNHEPLLLWFKIGDEEADVLLHDLFTEHKKGDTFCSDDRGLQEIFSHHFQSHHNFRITIIDVLHDSFFCFDMFKKHFKLKTNKEMLQKLIEAFSYRNNLSQRRTTVEESLALMLNKHKFSVPPHLVLRQEEHVMASVSKNPDYHVYKVQKDFAIRVQQLAEKQVKEALLLDQLAHNDNIIPSNADVKCFLNLTKRPRAKEFIYFDPPVTKINGKETPVCAEELRHLCTREKTLNHIIYHLTRK